MEPERPDPFLEACGAVPWRCAVASGPGALAAGDGARVLAQPYLVVGRQPGADLRLDDPDVSRRHTYFQVLGGRVYGVDLGSRTGTWLGGQPFHAGWISAGRAPGVGPFTLRFGAPGDASGATTGGPDPLRGPLDDATSPLPPVRLEVAVTGARPRVCRMAAALVLIGSGPMCRLRLRDQRIEAVHCSLVRTARGLWAVDLLADWGIAHNGYLVRACRLAPGDRLGVGPYAIRVLEAAEAEPAGRELVPAGLAPLPGVPAPALPAEALGRLEALERRQEAMQDQFQQSLMMVLQALGRMHHDQMQTVTAELAEVGRLSQAIDGLRAELRARAAEPPAAHPEPEPQAEPTHTEPPRVRRDPREVHALVSERLAAFERERQSRWNRILRTLGGAS